MRGDPFFPTMKPTQSGWTASELADQTAKQLPAYCDKPTERLVRYYTSVGILDKPSRTDNDKRRAIYGERQLYQLLLAMVFNYAGPGAVEAHKRGYFRFPLGSPTGTENNLRDLYHQAINPGGIAHDAHRLKAKVQVVAGKKGGAK
jgi:hypothetical protein